mgnify:CR=1 FL=1
MDKFDENLPGVLVPVLRRERIVDGQSVPTGGDVIVEFDGKQVETSAELQSAVEARRPGDTVEMSVLRDGDRRVLEVTLEERPEVPTGDADDCG